MDDGGRAIERRCGAIAVVSGAGLAAMYRSLGVDVLDGGLTLNPSTYDILAAIHSVPAEEVVVLPNSRNVYMAAQAAADISDKTVRVVQCPEQQAGLVAAVAIVEDRSAQENAAAMEEILAQLRTGTVAPAARPDAQGRFAVGDAVGYVGDELIAWGAPQETLRVVLGRLGEDAELLTVIRGQGAPLSDEEIEALAPAEIELEFGEGGQPSRWWLLSAE